MYARQVTLATPLSRDRILATAVEIADREGLDAASLRKVAGALDVHVTSLYHHVPTKEALLDGVAEQLLVRAGVPVGEVEWDDWVRGFVRAVARLAQAHPGAFAVMLRRPVQGPAASATFEAGLEAFRRAGMSVPEAYSAVKAVALSVLGCCLDEAFAATGDDLRTDVSRLPASEFPAFHEVIAVVDDVDVVGTLSEVLVAGLAARLPGR